MFNLFWIVSKFLIWLNWGVIIFFFVNGDILMSGDWLEFMLKFKRGELFDEFVEVLVFVVFGKWGRWVSEFGFLFWMLMGGVLIFELWVFLFFLFWWLLVISFCWWIWVFWFLGWCELLLFCLVLFFFVLLLGFFLDFVFCLLVFELNWM